MMRPITAAQAIEWANASPPGARWYSSGCGRIELALTLDDAQSASHPGQCDDDVAALMQVPYIAEQLGHISSDIAREIAAESGRNDYGHGPEDMEDREANLAFILWCACNDITEEEATK